MFTPRRDDQAADGNESGDGDSTLNATPKELMNSLEQIKLEEETKEIIDGYQKAESQEEINRLKELDGIYGGKNPGEIDFWKTIWEEYSINYDHGIPESYIPKAAIGALGLSPNKADDIVDIGKEFTLLVEAEPEAAVDLDYIKDDTDETILRLVLPEERPDLYVDDPKQYAERDTWTKIWNDIYGDMNVPINITKLEGAAKGLFNLETDAEVRAAIEVAQMSKAIRERNNKFIISNERPKQYWIDIWEFCNTPLGQPTSRSDIEFSVASKEIKPITEAEETVSEAIETGELYSPADAPDDQYTINDPATEDGPEISKDTSSEDDDNEGGDSQEHTSNASGSDGAENSRQESASTCEDQSGSAPSDQATSSTESATESAASSRAQSDAESSAGSSASAESDSENEGAESSQPTTETPDQSAGGASSESNSDGDTVDTESANESTVTVSDAESTSQDSDGNSSGETPPENEGVVIGGSSEDSEADEDVDPIKQRHEANRKSEDELDTATNPDGGVDFNKAMDEYNSDEEHTKFKTYSEPEGDDGEFDPDREAVKQFISQFCIVDLDNKERVKVNQTDILNALSTWAKINSVELEKLNEDVYIDNRKGSLKNIIEAEFDVERDQFRIDNDRTRGYRGMSLSEDGEKLLDMDVE